MEDSTEPSQPAPKRPRRISQLRNGYDCIFTNDPPEHLQIECSICLGVLHEPQLIDCHCGSSFCLSCIVPLQSEGKPCPLCRSHFAISMPDRRLQRTLSNLLIHCSFKDEGCEWVGELSKINDHLNASPSEESRDIGCHFVQVKCSYCKDELQRRFVLEHERNECLKRPTRCNLCDDYESTFEDVSTSHAVVCPSRPVDCPNECGESVPRKLLDSHLTNVCPLQVITCYAGCGENVPRRDIEAHVADNLASHLTIQAVRHQQQVEVLESKLQEIEKENHKLKQEVETLRSEKLILHTHMQIVPVYLTMEQFSCKIIDEDEWTSRPFYTHPHGYKMCLNVDPCGVEAGAGTHISVFLKIMRGQFDSHLSWPFRGSVTVVLLDQDGSEEHRAKMITFNANTPRECTCRLMKGENCNEGWGFSRFITHRRLFSKYLKKTPSTLRFPKLVYITILATCHNHIYS